MKKALNKRRCPRTIFVYTVQFKSIPELIPVCCSESYSRYLSPRATPDLLYIYLFCWTESYSRTIAPRFTPGFGAMSQIDHA